jgi:hypothetical protein
MLFLKAGAAVLSGNRLEIPAASAAPLMEKLGKNSRLAYFDSSRKAAALLEITDTNISPRHAYLTVSPVKTYVISPLITDTLFSRHTAFTFDKSFLNKLVRLSDSMDLPPVSFYFAHDKDSLSITVSDPMNTLYSRIVLPQRDLRAFSDDIIGILNRINQELRGNPDPDYATLFSPLQNAFGRLPLPFTTDIAFRRIDAFYEADAGGFYPFLPLETAFPNCFVRNLIPGGRAGFQKKNRRFTLVYSQDLKFAMKETGELIEYLRGSYKLESYPENVFREYQSELESSNYFHFNGHGEVRNGRGCLLSGGHWTERLADVKNMRLAVLNCCQTGYQSAGIVENLVRSGAHYVIASPFDIPDDTAYSFLKFYRCFNPENPELSYIISSLIDPKLPLFFRLFTSYTGKI